MSQLRWRTKTIYMNQPRSSFTAKKRVSFGVFSESHACLIAFPDNTTNYHKPKKTPVSPNSASSPTASFLAHELRNPLTNINLAIDLLDLSTTDIDQKEFIDVIRRSSARINILINEFIKCQKVEEIIEEKHSLNQLLDEVLEMAQDRIALKNIRIIKVYDADSYNERDIMVRGYSEGRDTVNRNAGLPAGTYFYILKYKKGNETINKTGYLYINNDK